MKSATCIQFCDDQMLTMTRILSYDIFESNNTSGFFIYHKTS